MSTVQCFGTVELFTDWLTTWAVNRLESDTRLFYRAIEKARCNAPDHLLNDRKTKCDLPYHYQSLRPKTLLVLNVHYVTFYSNFGDITDIITHNAIE